MTKRWPIVLIIAFPLLVYWPLTLAGRVLYWGVPLYQFYPWHSLVVAAVQAGDLPLWTDLLGNGAPLLANHQTAFFYPLNLIYFMMPVERAAGYSVVLHLILAGLFAYAWGRSIMLSRFGAAVVGSSFMLSGFLVSRTHFITIVNGAAWLPLLFLWVERLARRPRWLDALALGLTWALQFLAGHAQLWFYGLWAVGGYAILRAWWETNLPPQPPSWPALRGATSLQGKGESDSPPHVGEAKWPAVARLGERLFSTITLLVGAFILSLGLAAIQLLPTAELALQSQRAGGVDLDEAMTYSMWPWRLLTLAIPDLFGNPATGDYWGYATYWEDTGYIGILPLLLALAFILGLATGTVKKQWPGFPVVFFIVLILVSLVLAMGKNTPIYPLLFDHVPGFGVFRAPARFLLFYTFGVCTLAGLAADQFRLTYRTQYVLRLTGAGAMAMLAISWLMGQMDLPIKPTFAPAISRFALGLGLSAVVLLLCPVQASKGGQPSEGVDRRVMRSPLSLPLWHGLVVCFIAVDLALFAAPLTPTIDPALYHVITNADRFLLERVDDVRLFATREYDYDTKFDRYFDFSAWGPSDLTHWLSFRETLVPNLSSFTLTPSVNNDEPLVVGRWRRLMTALNEADWPVRLQLLRMMNVGYVMSESPPPGLSPVKGIPGLYQLADPLPRAWLVSHGRIVPDSELLLAELTAPAFDPAIEVLLELDDDQANRSNELGLEADCYATVDAASNPGSQRSLSPGGVSLHEGGNGRTIDLVVSQPSYLVLSYTYYPGWQATVDGRPTDLVRANYAFMAIRLEPGEHQVLLYYRPRSLIWGAILSSLSCLGVIGAVILRLPQFRKPR